MHGAWIPLFVALWLVVVLLVILVTGLIRRISALEASQPEGHQHHRQLSRTIEIATSRVQGASDLAPVDPVDVSASSANG